MKNKMKKWALSGLLGIATAVGSNQESFGQERNEHLQQTKAEKMLIQFPDVLPQAAEITKYDVPGAKHCLVHIRQLHYGFYSNGRDHGTPTNSAEYPFIIKTQNEIYQILTNLVTKLPIKKLYSESIVLDDFARDSIESEARIVTKLMKKDLEEYAKDRYANQAVARIELTKGIHRGATESQEAMDEARALLSPENKENLTYEKYCEVVVDGREDGVLETLAKNNEPLKVLIYGDAHCFGGTNFCGATYRSEMKTSPNPNERAIYALNKDNITEWNASHPEEKFSLIEVRPNGALEYDNFVRTNK